MKGQFGRQPFGGALGPGGDCECPSCGFAVPHAVGKPCYEVKCPRCGSQMKR